MESDSDTDVVTLTEDECWRLLSTAALGRLAVVILDEPEIFPVNFVTDGQSVVFRTAEGTKLFGLTTRPRVAFEVDEHATGREAWSVVLKGNAQRLENFSDIDRVEDLPLAPWQPGTKQWFVRISNATVTGIRFSVPRRPSPA